MAKKKNEIKIADINISEIAKNPELYPEEIVAVALTTFKKMNSEIYNAIKILEANIIQRMSADGATKMLFKDSGKNIILTLQSGAMECKADNADDVYKKAGFEPLEIGDYKFRPSWTKAKAARKFGGEKAQIIDALFVEGKKKLAIE